MLFDKARFCSKLQKSLCLPSPAKSSKNPHLSRGRKAQYPAARSGLDANFACLHSSSYSTRGSWFSPANPPAGGFVSCLRHGTEAIQAGEPVSLDVLK